MKHTAAPKFEHLWTELLRTGELDYAQGPSRLRVSRPATTRPAPTEAPVAPPQRPLPRWSEERVDFDHVLRSLGSSLPPPAPVTEAPVRKADRTSSWALPSRRTAARSRRPLLAVPAAILSVAVLAAGAFAWAWSTVSGSAAASASTAAVEAPQRAPAQEL